MRRPRFAPLLALVALASAVALTPAADVTVVENPVAASSFAEVRLTLGKGDSIIWEVSPEPTKVKEYTEGATAILHFNGPAGSYLVTADVINFDTRTRTKKKQTVVIGKPQPKPQPDPGPGPGPQPVPPVPPSPAGTPKKFVVVEDTAKAAAWRGDVMGSPKVASWYKASGMSHRLVDINGEGDDAAALAYKKLAAGKTLPYLWILDDAGKLLKEMNCPTQDDAFVAAFEVHEGPRALGAILEAPKLKWAKFGESPKTPLIPREQWKPVDLGTFLPPVHDQDGRGQCASSSACTVLEACRNQAGLPYAYLSAGDLYSRVNGGRDQGSMPEDNLNELITNGVGTADKVPYVWDGRKHADAATVAARKPYRITEAYLCDSFDAMASALQQGFILQEAIFWFDNFKPDAEGWLPASGRGNKGGHALCAYGLAKRGSAWGLKTRNSWGTSWGGSKDGSIGAGNCVIPETLFSFEFGSVWACRAVYQSPSDFPAPKASLAEPRRDPLRLNPFEREVLVLKP